MIQLGMSAKWILSCGVVVVSLLFLNTSVASAAQFLSVEMLQPRTAQQPRSFTVPYRVLSTGKTGKITIKLLQDNTEIASDVTIPGSNSGSFDVTVPKDGTYSYTLLVANNTHAATEASDSLMLTVVTPVEDEPSRLSIEGQEGNNNGVVAAETVNNGIVEGAAAQTVADPSTTNYLVFGLVALAVLVLTYFASVFYRSKKSEI